MGQRRGRRRRWLLGLTSVAAAGAAALALTPLLAGSGSRVNSQAIGSFLNQAETGVFDHNLAHRASPPAAKRAARAQAAACEDPAQVAADPEACPQDGATSREVAAAEASAAAPAPPALSEASDGLWGPLQQIPSTAVHGVLMPTGKVLYFSQPKYPTETEAADGGTAHVWDPATGQTKAVPPPVVTYEGRDSGAITAPANLWCGGQTLLPDGRVLVVGGNLEYPTPRALGDRSGFKGAKWVMTFDPWTETWTRYQDMPHGRWYPTLTTLPDGKVLIIGGWDETGGDAGGDPSAAPVMKNDQDVEVFDPAKAVGAGADPTTVVSPAAAELRRRPGLRRPPYPDHQGIGLYPHAVRPAGHHRRRLGGPPQGARRRPAAVGLGDHRHRHLGVDGRPRPALRARGRPPVERPRLGHRLPRALRPERLHPGRAAGRLQLGRRGAGRGLDRAAAEHGGGARPERLAQRLAPRPRPRPAHRPRPLQHGAAARRLDLHQRRRLRAQGREHVRRPGLLVRAAGAGRRRRLAHRGQRAGRPHLPLDGAAAARRAGDLRGRRPGHRARPTTAGTSTATSASPTAPTSSTTRRTSSRAPRRRSPSRRRGCATTPPSASRWRATRGRSPAPT